MEGSKAGTNKASQAVTAPFGTANRTTNEFEASSIFRYLEPKKRGKARTKKIHLLIIKGG